MKHSKLAEQLRFLVVDDSSTMRRIIARNLRDIGAKEVLEADHGKEALMVLERERVDFVVSDWKMPVMDGITLLRTLRESERFCQMPFLMVTAESASHNLMEAIRCGVSNYLTKPFQPMLFRMKVEAILRNTDRGDGARTDCPAA